MLASLLAFTLAAQGNTGSLSGRVVDAATGQSLTGATVTVCHGRDVPEPKCDSLQVRTNGDGVFRIDNIAAGLYDAFAAAPRHLIAENRVSFLVSAGQESAPITIQIQPEGSIRGRVLNADGSPVTGAVVESLVANQAASFCCRQP
jgi:hypothetical protein